MDLRFHTILISPKKNLDVECETEATKDKVQTTSSESTAYVKPPVVQVPILEPEVALKPNPKPSIPYPSRLLRPKSSVEKKPIIQLVEFIFQIFQRLPLRYYLCGMISSYAENSLKSGNPTPSDLIIPYSSPSVTPLEGGDFILWEEIENFSTRKQLSNLVKDEEKAALLKVLKSHKRAIAWKISDIKGIDPRFCTHKILMEDDFKSAVQHQRRVNQKIYEVIKKEVIKLLDAELIYPIFDSLWVSLVHCVPKKCGMTVVENEDNELIPTRLVTGWRVCIDYRKLNDATRKDHFPLPFMDQMLERLAGNEYYCFLDGFFGYFQNPIDLQDQEKTTFTCPYGTFAYRRIQARSKGSREPKVDVMLNSLSDFHYKQNPSGLGSLPSNTVANPRGDVKAITTQSGVAYDGPTIPPTPSPLPKEVEHETEATKDKPEVAPKPKPKPSIPYPLRLNDQKLHEKANNQMLKFLQIFQRLHFDLSFADALLHMIKFASMFKSLLSNKEKLFELASTLLNENCSAVLLKKLPEKHGDPGKFLILCDFPKLVECLALADLGASINLMPLFVWKKLSLPELTPTRMTLELANQSIAIPVGVAEDVFVKVGKFHFLAKFVLTLRVNDEAITFKVGQTSRYSCNYYDEMVHQVNVIDVACDEYAQEVLRFLDSSTSGNPTPLDPIIVSSSPSFTLFEGGDFILEEIEACLSSDSIPPGIDYTDFDPKGDIRILDKLLNNDPSSPLPSKELKFEELKMIKSSIDDFSPLDVLEGNFVTFSNPLFDSNEEFTSSDDESPPEADVLEENFKIYSNPLFEFDEEYISSNVNPLFNEVLEDIKSEESYVSNHDEPALLVMPLSDTNGDECFDLEGDIDEIDDFLNIDVSMDIEDSYHNSEGDIIYLENLLNNVTILYLPPEVFLDHDLRSLKDELDNNDLKSMVKVFDLGISAYSFYSLEPVAYESPMEDCPDYEDSRARGFCPLSLELLSFAYHYVEILSGESKVHIEVLSVLWGNRLSIPDGSLPLSRVMSSRSHPTSNIEDAFSSNFTDYISASPDYVIASPGKTYSSSSNNSFESPILPPTIMPPSSMLSPMFNSQEFFLPKELLPLKKRGRYRSSSSTSALPQAFEIGESSQDKVEGLGQGQVIIQQDFDNLEAELQKKAIGK
ncbi:reverse transcriptase domain-containing protein [Tanacetum coccineum]